MHAHLNMGEHAQEFTFVGFGQGLKFDFAQHQACIFAQDSSFLSPISCSP